MTTTTRNQEPECPKCQGTMAQESDLYGPYVHCLRCGLHIDLPKPGPKTPAGGDAAPPEDQTPREKTHPSPAGGDPIPDRQESSQ